MSEGSNVLVQRCGWASCILAALGFAGPIASEVIRPLSSPPISEYLLIVAPVCWLVGLLCGIVAWKTWPGRIAIVFYCGLIVLWAYWAFVLPPIRFG